MFLDEGEHRASEDARLSRWLTPPADTPDLFVRRFVRGVAEVCGGFCGIWLIHRRRHLRVVIVTPGLRVRRLSDRQSGDEQRKEDALQQFLQIFPTVLSALSFS
jgi:hypothetical protein